MGRVLQFAEQLAVGEDWTPGERAQLREIGVQLSGSVGELEMVFGSTEQGDPWYAVVDASGEVLLHIARIDGTFVVHSGSENRSVEGSDLWSTAAGLLGDALRERRGVLLAFPFDGWAPPAALAFIVAALLRDEIGEVYPFAPAHVQDLVGDLPPHDAAQVQAELGDARGSIGEDAFPQRREADEGPAREAAQSNGSTFAPPLTEEASSPDASSAPAPVDRSSALGRAMAEAPGLPKALPPTDAGSPQVAQGGAGTQGFMSQEGAARLAQGSDGDDRILLGGGIVAEGGAGADVFVAPTPATTMAARQEPAMAGFVADFREGEGDRIEFAGVRNAQLTNVEWVPDVLVHLRNGSNAANLPVISGRKLNYDLNDDGKPDAFVLTTQSGGAWLGALRPLPSGRGVEMGVDHSPPAVQTPGLSPGFAPPSLAPAAAPVESMEPPFTVEAMPVHFPAPEPYAG